MLLFLYFDFKHARRHVLLPVRVPIASNLNSALTLSRQMECKNLNSTKNIKQMEQGTWILQVDYADGTRKLEFRLNCKQNLKLKHICKQLKHLSRSIFPHATPHCKRALPFWGAFYILQSCTVLLIDILEYQPLLVSALSTDIPVARDKSYCSVMEKHLK